MTLPQPIFERDEITNEYKVTKRAKKLLKKLREQVTNFQKSLANKAKASA